MSGEWSDDMTAAYRRWIFISPEGDIDINDEDLLATTQEDAFRAGFIAGTRGPTKPFDILDEVR